MLSFYASFCQLFTYIQMCSQLRNIHVEMYSCARRYLLQEHSREFRAKQCRLLDREYTNNDVSHFCMMLTSRLHMYVRYDAGVHVAA